MKYEISYNASNNPCTHYIDVKQGAVIHLLVDDNDIIKTCYETRYGGRLKKMIENKDLSYAKKVIHKHHLGISIHKF